MKKITALILALMLLCSSVCHADNISDSRTVIGADLDSNEIASVYKSFGIERGDVKELTVTNADERKYLEGQVDESLIGTRSISCIYIEAQGSGEGLDVSVDNITWCTADMYMNAMVTAGITDANVKIVAPYKVSGTAALTGIYMAYEDITGKKLDEDAKLVGTKELTITAELADEIGSADSTAIVNELKLMLDIAKEHELFIICDEVYREFTYGGEPLMSGLQFEGYEDNVIVIDSVSKRFSACGARVGMLISKNKEFMAQAMKWCQCRLCSATVDQVGAAALYSLDPSYFDEIREEYRHRRDTMVSKLKEIPGVVCEMPKGAFYVMAALPVDDADKFQMWLLNEYNDHGDTVLFACGEPFYATPGKGRNEVRLAYTINAGDITRAIEILGRGIEEYNKTH